MIATIAGGLLGSLLAFGFIWFSRGGLRRHRRIRVIKQAMNRNLVRGDLLDQLGYQVGHIHTVNKQVENLREYARLVIRADRTRAGKS